MQETKYYESPIGWFRLIGSELGLQSVKKVDTIEDDATPDAPQCIYDAIAQLKAYFNRELTDFEVKLDWSDATDFNKAVWNTLIAIPYGHTTSYSAIAKKINKPKAAQAVGLANKLNPIAIIVPCHRVIGKNGDLTGYFYGVEVKRQLLELENPMSYAEQGRLF